MIDTKFDQYDTYTSRQIKWIGDVPAHWDIKRIKEVSIINNKNLPEETPSNYKFDYVDIGNVVYGIKGYITEKLNFGSAPSRARRIVKKGDTIISTVRTYLKAITSIEEDVSDLIVSTGFAVISPKNQLNYKYVSYLLQSEFIINEISSLSKGVSYPAINSTTIGDLFFLIPSIPEQTAIAEYLNNRIAKIDHKIELLGKKAESYHTLKQSLINETVTRGLDTTMPLKNSKISWIGKVPKHWEITAVTNIMHTVSYKNNPNEELLSVYRDYGVIVKSTRDDNHNKAGANLSNYKLVKPGYLVMNKMKAWQGSLGVSDHRGIVSPAYITCKTNSKVVNRRYLHHLLRCRNYINEYNRLSYGVRVDQWDMRYDDFKYVPILLPPIDEQQAIAKYIDEKTTKIDNIITTTNKQIDKLKELRKTLINDVVTGKIRVTKEESAA